MKKNILVTSGLATGLLLLLNTIGTIRLCGGNEGSCVDNWYNIMVTAIPIIPLFIFSLATYKLNERVYLTWLNFTKWWIPLSIFGILISPSYSNDWIYPIEKGTVALFFSLVYLVVSLVLILYKHFSLNRD